METSSHATRYSKIETSENGKPKIAVYLHSLFNGGIERVMINLMQAFLERGIAVDLVLDYLLWSPFEPMIPAQVNVVKLEAHSAAQRVTKLVGYLRETRPDALLSGAHVANEIACIAKSIARTGTRVVVTEHGNMSSDITVSSTSLRRFLLPLGTRLLYPLADAAVAVSYGVAEDVCRVSGLRRDRMQTIYNPIDYKSLTEMAGQPVDHPWFASGEPPVIIALGRLERPKNFTSLIHAFAEVRRHREARLLILGEGSERDKLTSLVAELKLEADVSLPGFVANPLSYIANSSLLAMSSLWEGMPVALIEAVALGVPVVSTDCPSGPNEILASGKYGELVPMDDSAALAAAIQRALATGKRQLDPEWFAQFDVNNITDKYLNLLLPGFVAH